MTYQLVLLARPVNYLFHYPKGHDKQEHGWCEALFQCGNITAGFPFWGGNRHEHCGHPSLKLHCNKNNSATLIILDQEYSVLHLNHTSYTLTLARRDHLGSFCSSNFTNIILPPNIFELSSTYENLTVFYQCESFHPYLPSDTCPNKGFISVSDNPGYHETCHDNFTVNVPKSFVLKEEERDVAHLESSLKKGFEVKVKIDAKACEKCLSSHRRCGFNEYLPSEVKCGPLPPQTGISPGAKIGLGVCVILFVLLVITSFLQILRKRKRKTSHDMTQQNLKTLNPQHDLKALITLKQYSYANVKRITKSFTEVHTSKKFSLLSSKSNLP
ncbi:unnamed protein product [Thlaspi arvense]|uniref:non-specific serine/threonine protein kinase n=1 Tax=Thlaspi arvense TaxID=13288 RepID=A0AAU9SKX8_THLAR|nr:unnamed protein product [Thlaspi arvense]